VIYAETRADCAAGSLLSVKVPYKAAGSIL